MKHIISLGAGVQSSTMALMAAHGEITPMPDAAIFADTQAEPKNVMTHLDWLEKELPFPVYRVTAGNLEADSLDESRGYARRLIPMRLLNDKPEGGFLGRVCTGDYKVKPVERKVKEILGLSKNDRWPTELSVVQWLGISLDEIQRMKVSVSKWQEFRHPLIELRMSRWDCLNWMERNGYPEPPRSACYFCPFHSNEEWRNLTGEDFERAVKFEQEIQRVMSSRLDGVPFLHRDRVPLDEVDLSTAEENGQISWLDECAGMCGV